MSVRALALSFACLLVAVAASPDAGAQTSALDISVSNLRSDRGVVLVNVDTEASWFRDSAAPMRSLRLTPANRSAQIRVEGLPPGDYAIRVHHDENGDGRLNTGLFGIPSERYGFSGRSRRLGPPPFAEAKFEFPEFATQAISLR
jgi:uncharacterized protein (DUF2141 family)